MTLFEALTGGAFDRLNWQHSGEFDQNFSKKPSAPGFARGGGMGGFGIDRYITQLSSLSYLAILDELRATHFLVPNRKLGNTKWLIFFTFCKLVWFRKMQIPFRGYLMPFPVRKVA